MGMAQRNAERLRRTPCVIKCRPLVRCRQTRSRLGKPCVNSAFLANREAPAGKIGLFHAQPSGTPLMAEIRVLRQRDTRGSAHRYCMAYRLPQQRKNKSSQLLARWIGLVTARRVL